MDLQASLLVLLVAVLVHLCAPGRAGPVDVVVAAPPLPPPPPPAAHQSLTLASASLPAEGLEFPNTALLPGDLTEQLGVDNFFSLWLVFLDADIFTSDKNFTILAPVNEAPMRPTPSMEDKDRVRQLLLNHIVLGTDVSDQQLQDGQGFTLNTLGGQLLRFESRPDGATVNGVEIVKSGERVPNNGVILVLRDYLFMDVYHGDVMGSHSTHLPSATTKKATPTRATTTAAATTTTTTTTTTPSSGSRGGGVAAIPMVTSSTSGEGGFPMIELGTHDLQDNSEVPHHLLEVSTAAAERAMDIDASAAFYDQLVQALGFVRSATAEFTRYLKSSGLADRFQPDGLYTAFVPMDDSFIQWYPIDWGFNPFDVDEFARETILNHFVQGDHPQANLTHGQVLTTLGGKKLKVATKPKLSINGVEIFDGDTSLGTRGTIQFVSNLFFVNSSVVSDLNARHPDVESAPLLAHPWYSSQFLSHTFRELGRRENDFRFIVDYLNRSHHELPEDLPSHDNSRKMMRYTFFVPNDAAFSRLLFADAPDPLIVDDEFRHRVLLGHFVHQRLYAKDLVDGSTFRMANGATAHIRVDAANVTYINGARILESNIFIYNLGNIFVIDDVLFVTTDMILDVLDKHPSQPWFQTEDLEGGPEEENVEDHTLVLDLEAEFEQAKTTSAAATEATVSDEGENDGIIIIPSGL